MSGASSSSSGTTFQLPKSLKGPAPSSVKIALSGGYAVNFLPTIVAMGAGYFNTVAKRFNTSISFDIYGSGQTSEPAFLGGTDSWIVIGPTSASAASVQGKDQVFVMNEQIGLGGDVIGPAKYQSSRGTNAAAYAGSTWCQIQPQGSSNTTVLLLAATNNVPTSAINLTTIGSVAAVLPSIQSGQCALVSGDANSAALGSITGVSYVIDNLNDPQATIALAGEQLGSSGVATSHAFISQYPKFSQAMTDAVLAGLLYVQANANNPNKIYNVLPSAMTATLSLGAFVQTMGLFGQAYSNPKFNNGEFPVQAINDTASLLIATNSISTSSPLNPSQLWSNKYIMQAYKDLGVTPVNGPASGPATLPSTVGQPSAQMAKAYGTLTGKPAPANSGPAPMSLIPSPTSSSTSSSTSTTS
jgi:hypothetical protein